MIKEKEKRTGNNEIVDYFQGEVLEIGIREVMSKRGFFKTICKT